MSEIVRIYQPLVDFALRHDVTGYGYIYTIAELLLAQPNGNYNIEQALESAKSNLSYYCDNYNIDQETIKLVYKFYDIYMKTEV